MMDSINKLLAFVLTKSWAVPVLVLGILVGCAAILVRNRRRHYAPMTRALKARLDALAPVEGAASIGEAQDRFVTDFQQIDEAMRSDDVPSLAHAWTEYAETVVDSSQPIIQTTARPDEYLQHLGDDTRVLAWWANLFVAIGLTFTFLGIVAALSYTSDNLKGSDAQHMSGVLTTLLALTAAKFWTSIAGVGASIVLRVFDRRWHSATGQRLARLAHAIERGTVYLPPQRVAVEQLSELRQQSTAMSEFTTQLAVGISDALAEKMQPLVIGLSSIQKSIDQFKDGATASIGKAVGESAGAQMDALATALAAMTAGLEGVNQRLESGGRDASEHIASAAKEFAVASEDMRRAFDELNGNIATMADKLVAQAGDAAELNARRLEEERQHFDAVTAGNRQVMQGMAEELRESSTVATSAMVEAVRRAISEAVEQGNVASRQALQDFSGASGEMRRVFSELNGNIATMADKLVAQAGDAAELNARRLEEERQHFDAVTAGNRQVMQGMAEELRESSTVATSAMIDAVRRAISEAVEQGNVATRQALQDFAGASSGIAQTLDAVQNKVLELGDRLAGSASEAADRNAQVLAKAASALEAATGQAQASMGKAIADAAARSAAESSRAIEAAFAEFTKRFEGASSGLTTTLTSTTARMEALAGAIGRSTDAANDHANRMSEVGREVGATSTMLSQAASALNAASTPVRDGTDAIRRAVDQVTGTLTRAEEHAQRSEDSIGTIAQSLSQTSDATAKAWEDYKSRFERVDQDLEAALVKVSNAIGEHAHAVNEQIGRVDTALADAVDKLHHALDPLSDLAAALEDQRAPQGD